MDLSSSYLLRLRSLHQSEQRDGRGHLPLGFLDAVEFAVHFTARRLVASSQFLTLTRAHGQQNIVAVDAFQRPRGKISGLGAGDFSNEPRGSQSVHDLAHQAAGDTDLAGNFGGAGRRIAADETLADAGHQAQGDEFAAALVDVFDLLFLHVRDSVLKRVGYLRSKKKNQPRKIEADHKNGHQTQTAIDPAV